VGGNHFAQGRERVDLHGERIAHFRPAREGA
jgi:hypothetical protein